SWRAAPVGPDEWLGLRRQPFHAASLGTRMTRSSAGPAVVCAPRRSLSPYREPKANSGPWPHPGFAPVARERPPFDYRSAGKAAPKICVVTLHDGDAEALGDTADSLVGQSLQAWEWHVIGGVG